MNSLLPTIVAFMALIASVFIYNANKKHPSNITFALFCFCTFMWQASWAVLFQVSNPEIAKIMVRVGYFFIIYLPAFLFNFFTIISKSKADKPLVILNYTVSTLFVLFLPTNLFINDFYTYSWGFYPKAGILHPVYFFFGLALYFRGIYLMIRHLQRTGVEEEQKQIKIILFGLFVFFIAAIDYLCNYGFDFYPPGVLFVFLAMFIMAYGVLKYSVMDMKVVATNTTSFFFTFAIFVGLYLFVDFSMVHMGLDVQKIPRIINFAYIVFCCALFTTVRNMIHRPIENKLMQGFYDIQNIITKISSELLLAQTQYDVLKTMSRTLREELKTQECFFIFCEIGSEQFSLYHDSNDSPVFQLNESGFVKDEFFDVTEPKRFKYTSDKLKSTMAPFQISNNALVFPIHSIEQFHGVFILGEKTNKKMFNESEINTIEAIINQLMVIFDRIIYKQKIEDINKNLEKKVQAQVKEIEEKRKIEVDLNIANDIQQLLLPERLPQITNYAFDAMFKPAKSISGDYYDFFMFSETKIGVMIADVAGKGIPAALLMANLKNVVTQHVSADKSPAKTIKQLNSTICESRVFKKHIPVVYGVLDTQKNTFTYCNAGHDAGKYYSEGKVKLLDKGGIPLGLYEEDEYEEEILTLSKNDFVTFYTDGIPDARNRANESFGEDQVDSIIQQYIEKPNGGSFTEILQSYWLPFVGSMPLKDDTTLVSIYFCPQEFGTP